MLPNRLIDGYHAFLYGRLPQEQQRFANLAQEGQKPKVMIVGCCDSRVSPEVIFDARPGEIFVLRNVANLVPPYEPDGGRHSASAALEFAVQSLKVEHIVILGHARCGGVRAFADDASEPLSPGDFIGKWMTLLAPTAERIGPQDANENLGDYVERLGHASVRTSLANLRTFPCVSILEGRGRLSLHGAYFDVASGRLDLLNEATGTFAPTTTELPSRISLIGCV
jgi:carbonic anhydrase